MANKKAIGNLGEDIALKYLEGLGFSLLERNFKGKKTRGEIDLVMTKGVVIVFIEVKYRRQGSFGYAAYSISERKKRKLYETAEEYLIEKGLSFNQKCSFGAVLIDDTHYKREISFIEDIFIQGYYMKTAVKINPEKIDLYKKKLKDKKYIDKAIEGLAGNLISYVID